MGHVIFAINITIDGCCDHTNTIADEEVLEYYTHLLREADLLVYGGFLIGRMSQKTSLRQKRRTNLPGRLTPATKLFSHDH
ncbi:MAG TPA: hypothetical protein VEI73_13005 [Candidatus Acidoferrum sp.]|nr:hypothetical protein [Candidatus Acidoferrum sp.]